MIIEGWHDPRSPLVLEPLRYALELRPRWIALEQVPPVLPLWHAIAEALQQADYCVDVGVLSAEQFGVPQTRKRAILVARYGLEVALPAPTHRKYRKGVAQHEGDPALLPWVSMAQALGWGLPARPSPTITGGGTSNGGAEPIAHLDRYVDQFEVVTNNDSRLGGGRTERYHRDVEAPSPAITSGTRSWHLMNGAGAGNTTVDPRPVEVPAQTITGKGTAAWIGDRPATTVCGDARITPPGHRDWSNGGESQFDKSTTRVSVAEAAMLQTFPADYPWQGFKTSQYRQIGDAVPPLLALAVLRSVLEPP